MAVHPLHRVGCRKGKMPGEHEVIGNTQGIEVASRINRAVHSPGLFGCHVGESAGNKIRRIGRLSFAQQARRYTETSEAYLSARATDEHIGWPDVLVDKTALVGLAQGHDDAYG